MSIFRGNRLLLPSVNFLSKSKFSFAHKLVDIGKKDDEVLPFDFYRENCILVDTNDTNVGSASKRDCHRVEGDQIRLHRAFSVFLFNKDGDMLLQKRSSHKVIFFELATATITLTCVKSDKRVTSSISLAFPSIKKNPKKTSKIFA